jgi:hypothetical protein
MRHAHPGGFVVLGGHDCRAAFPGFSWSHLWSHSCRFGGVRGGLRRLGSGVAGPNRTSSDPPAAELASVLFLVGISSHFPSRGVRYGLIALSTAVLVVALVQLAQLPRPPS